MNNTETDRINALKAAGELISKAPLILDTETTGISSEARIVDIAIMDLTGNVLFESLVNPEIPIPVEASRIHGITDEIVKDAPTWPEVSRSLSPILFANSAITGYNVSFDLRMIEQMDQAYYDLDLGTFYPDFDPAGDIMQIYAAYNGDWNGYHQSFRWQKLTAACQQLGIEFEQEAAHQARYDCELARQVLVVLNQRRIVYEQMSAEIQALAHWRQVEREAKKKLAEIRAEIEARPDWKTWSDRSIDARQQIDIFTDEIRSYALTTLRQVGIRSAHPAVSIRQITKLKYDYERAIAWCIEHLPQALTLDEKLFEKHAKAVAKTDPIRFVEIVAEPQATIATDLSAYLAPVDEAPAVEPRDIPF